MYTINGWCSYLLVVLILWFLRYVIPCETPAYIYSDNQSLFANMTIPDSTLQKKSQTDAYHFVREGSARDEWQMSYINTHENEADLLTKLLLNGEKWKGFVRRILHQSFIQVLVSTNNGVEQAVSEPP